MLANREFNYDSYVRDQERQDNQIESLETWVKHHEEVTTLRLERLAVVEQQMKEMREWRVELRKIFYFVIANTIALLAVIVAGVAILLNLHK